MILSLTATPTSGIGGLTTDQVIGAVRLIASDLGQSIITAVGMIYPGDYQLVTPSGAILEVTIDDDAADDGRLMLTDDSRHRWAVATSAVAAD